MLMFCRKRHKRDTYKDGKTKIVAVKAALSKHVEGREAANCERLVKTMDKLAACREAEYLAANSAKINSVCTDMILGFMRTRGRPHLRIGSRVLLQHPVSLALAIIQCALVPVLLHDAMITFQLTKFLAVFGTDFTSKRLWIHPSAIRPIYAYAIALFVMNVFWAVMAAEISAKPLVGRISLAGLMGWLPMPGLKSLILPHWAQSKMCNGSKEAMWGTARLSQAVAAFWLGTGYSKPQTDLALARSLDKHGDEIMDGLSSYVMYPIAMIILFFCAIVLYYWYTPVQWVAGQDVVRQPAFYFPLTLGDMFLVYAAWLAYNRAALYAMIMSFMAKEAIRPPAQVEWECRKITWHYWLAILIENVMIMMFFAAIIVKVLAQAIKS